MIFLTLQPMVLAHNKAVLWASNTIKIHGFDSIVSMYR